MSNYTLNHDDSDSESESTHSSSHVKYKSFEKTRTFEINLKHSNTTITSFISTSDLETIYADYDSSQDSSSDTSNDDDDYSTNSQMGLLDTNDDLIYDQFTQASSPSLNKVDALFDLTSFDNFNLTNNSEITDPLLEYTPSTDMINITSSTSTIPRKYHHHHHHHHNIFHNIVTSNKWSLHRKGKSSTTTLDSFTLPECSTSLLLHGSPSSSTSSSKNHKLSSKLDNYKRFFPKTYHILHKL
ncbi:hypothetical protein DFJ63DRAFT_314796 [Scheffersomyces coipomensis]|uniref:uncharacterized protein n=1 Tax=Scheffersomyces coipomensis TaxID=1788519 RepID=UPI00315D0E95